MTDNKKIGEVQIANEVVAIIAGIAATEVDGVAAMAGDVHCRQIRHEKSGQRCKSGGKRGYGSSRSCHLFEVWIQYS